MRLQWIVLLCGLLAAPPKPVKTARTPNKTARDDVVVDMVQTRQGPQLLGAVLNRTSRGDVSIAVEREWLEQTHPQFFSRHIAKELDEARVAWAELQDRLEEWSRRRPGEGRLSSFIDQEVQRAAQRGVRMNENPVRLDDQFVIVDVAARQVERIQTQPPARRQIAMVAWRELLSDVATRSSGSLSKELEERGIDVAAERVNLGERLPIRRQSDQEWQARRALLEYLEREPLDYQGTGDLLIQTGSGQPSLDLAGLISQVVKSQLQTTLNELLGGVNGAANQRKNKGGEVGLEKAQREASEKQIDGLRATRLTLDVDRRQATVEGLFSARLDSGTWITVWKERETQAAAAGDKDQRDRIRNDPQLKQVLELLKSSGGAADDALETALGVGAATMTAQDRVNDRFTRFSATYRLHADGPPLFLPDAE